MENASGTVPYKPNTIPEMSMQGDIGQEEHVLIFIRSNKYHHPIWKFVFIVQTIAIWKFCLTNIIIQLYRVMLTCAATTDAETHSHISALDLTKLFSSSNFPVGSSGKS